MNTALYYPHTQIRDEQLLKNALLIWDRVEFISPFQDFRFNPVGNATYREGLELICRPHIPTSTQQRNVHSRLVKLLSNGIPPWVAITNVPQSLKGVRSAHEYRQNDAYEEFGIYPQKLASRTWRMLEDCDLVKLDERDQDYYARPLVGFLLMSLLADACAGSTKVKITDRIEAYSFLWRMAAMEAGAEYVSEVEAIADRARDRLVTISLNVLNTDSIPLDNLVQLRKRESSSAGHDYRAFRRKYSEKIRDYVKRLMSEAKTQEDWKEIQLQFQDDLKDDLKSLRGELRLAKTSLVFSKQIGVMGLAIAGLFTEPISSSALLAHTVHAIGWGALVDDVLRFRGSYQNALLKHPMSWLYLAEKPNRRDLFRNIAAPGSRVRKR